MRAAGKPAMRYSEYLGNFTEQMVKGAAERDQ